MEQIENKKKLLVSAFIGSIRCSVNATAQCFMLVIEGEAQAQYVNLLT